MRRNSLSHLIPDPASWKFGAPSLKIREFLRFREVKGEPLEECASTNFISIFTEKAINRDNNGRKKKDPVLIY